MKKRRLLLMIGIILSVVCIFVITAFATAEEETPSLSIARNTLELKNAVFMNFKVESENIDDTTNIKLLVWEELPAEYTKDTADVALSAIRMEEDTDYLVFQYDDLAAKDMTKIIYACAYASIDGEEIYSKPVKFSIFQYAHNALISESSSAELKGLLTNMLQYGAASQTYFDHNTDFLATDTVAKIKVVNGTHADGFKTGYYKAGTSVTLTANALEEGYIFSHWENSEGQIVGTESTLTIDECVSETYTAVYTDANSTVQYRYRDKQYTTSQTLLEEPWVLYDTTTTYTHSGYNYMYLRRSLGGTDYGYSYDDIVLYKATNSEKYCFHGSPIEMYQYVRKYVSAGPEYIYLTYSETEDVDLTKYSFYQNCWALKYCTQKTEQKTHHYYQWSAWSEWGDTPITATDDREVEVRGIFTVSYDANGGENAPEAQTKAMGESIEISATIPTRTGYAFKGWSSTIDGVVEYRVGDTYTADSTVTLYAVWEANVYTISYDANGGENTPQSQRKTYGMDIALSTTLPTKEGHTFQGWATSADGSVVYQDGDICSVNQDLTLYAVWQINTYTITYNANGGENVPAVQSKTHGIDLALSNTIPTREGYAFQGWATTVDGTVVYNTGDTYSANENVTLYAVWKIIDSLTIIDSGNCGDNLTWTLFENRELIISGTGQMTDYNLYNNRPPWYGYRSFITKIVIGDSVTTIGKSSFGNCENLTNISMGRAVITIREQAFTNCKALEHICITDAVEHIEGRAFADCSNLFSVDFSTNITFIGRGAFQYCTKLNNVILPNSLTSISPSTFYYCEDLVNISIPSTITEIGDGAFANCFSLSNVFIENVAKWCEIDFYDITANPLCYAENLYLNNAIVTTLVIPDNIKAIANYAFYGCDSITHLTIPNTVTTIGLNAFDGCTNLKTVYYSGTEDDWANITIGSSNKALTNATRYYYSENQPTITGNYWHYDENGNPVMWQF